MHAFVIAAMLAVIASCAALIVTSLDRSPEPVRRLRGLATAAWIVVLVAGWIGVGYLAFGTAGGLDAAWAWTQTQPVAWRIAMWLFLLPWMGSLAIWQATWATALKGALIVGLAALTLVLSVRQK